MHSWTPLLLGHVLGAGLAVLAGGVMALRRQRGDQLHRRLGRVWFVAMYWVTLSSFGIQELTPGRYSWIHGLSAFTLCTLTLSLWGARTGRIRVHRRNALGSYFGLLGAGIAASAFPNRLIPETLVHDPVSFAVAVGAVVLAFTATLGLSSARRRPRSPGATGAAPDRQPPLPRAGRARRPSRATPAG